MCSFEGCTSPRPIVKFFGSFFDGIVATTCPQTSDDSPAARQKIHCFRLSRAVENLQPASFGHAPLAYQGPPHWTMMIWPMKVEIQMTQKTRFVSRPWNA